MLAQYHDHDHAYDHHHDEQALCRPTQYRLRSSSPGATLAQYVVTSLTLAVLLNIPRWTSSSLSSLSSSADWTLLIHNFVHTRNANKFRFPQKCSILIFWHIDIFPGQYLSPLEAWLLNWSPKHISTCSSTSSWLVSPIYWTNIQVDSFWHFKWSRIISPCRHPFLKGTSCFLKINSWTPKMHKKLVHKRPGCQHGEQSL